MAGANIKVELNTKPAQKKLQQLGKQGEATARRISAGRETGGAGFGGGLVQGFGVGTGFALGKKVAGSVGVFSAIGDVVGEAFSGVTAIVDSGLEAPAARAKKAAREDTVSKFALQAGLSNDTTAARAYYNNALAARFGPEAEGAAAIRTATAGSKASGLNTSRNPLDHVFDGIMSKIESGFESLINAVKGGG